MAKVQWEEIVEVLLRVLERKYLDTAGHCRRVGYASGRLARQLGWTEPRIGEIEVAATLHDIGKIDLPNGIILKQRHLTPEERELIKRHTVLGGEILHGFTSSVMHLAEEIAWGHHERWDGTGYPRQLKSEEIPEAARIVAVVDVFDSLVHPAPWREGFKVMEAIGMVAEGRGGMFEPRVVDAFLENNVLKSIVKYMKGSGEWQ